MNNIITKNASKIIATCKKHKVKELYAFGSVVRDDFNINSDIANSAAQVKAMCLIVDRLVNKAATKQATPNTA